LLGTFGIPFIEYVYCSFDSGVAPTGVAGVEPFPLDRGDPVHVVDVNLSNSPIVLYFYVYYKY